MIVVPVIARELRACARQPFTYYLRALGVAALMLACFLFGMQHGFGPALGSRLFSSLHFTLFCAIWLLVPPLTADCLSRERREGTLGLLFLTRLSATDIVTAKCLAHGLRALTLWLAALPVVTIPFLLGGVSWIEALLSVAINFSAICWALAAGLLASAWSKRWVRSLLAAAVLSILFVLSLAIIIGQIMTSVSRIGANFRQSNIDFMLLTGLSFMAASSSYLRFVPSVGQLLWAIGMVSFLSLLALLLAITLAGRKTERVWQDEPPSASQVWWEKTFCTPIVWVAFFRRWMLRKLERNPIGWLEQRTWSGRLVTWGWFAVVISLYTAFLTDRNFFRWFRGIQDTMAWLLVGSLAMSAAGSFRRERETGVLELLLVSPLRESDIISGRLRGLWGQFLPAFGLLLGLWAYFDHLFRDTYDSGAISFHAITFLTLPVIGLYYSLRCRNFLTAFMATLLFGLLAPVVLAAFFRSALWPWTSGRWEMGLSGGTSLVQMIFAAVCWTALYRRLKARAFQFTQESLR